MACTASGEDATRTSSSISEATTPTTSLTASQVFAEVSPSLAYVATSLATGSGIMIDERFVVTNAHVVWPFRVVDIIFANGTRGVDVPVVAVDWVADLALVDVTTLQPLPPSARFSTPPYGPGDEVYLIGYPDDDPDQPAPAITSGVISRTRTWKDGELDFIQSDALISGGQSGGALVARSGAIIGITSLEVGDGFALALDATDVQTRIDAMVAQTDLYGIGDRWLETLAVGGTPPPPVHRLDEAVFVFDASAGETISIVITSGDIASGSIVGPDGFLEATLDGDVMEFTAELSGPHFAAIVPSGSHPSAIGVSANVDLRLLRDPDRAVPVLPGTVHYGNIDYPGDLDWFSIDLHEGQTVMIAASSPNADMAILVGPISDPTGPEAGSDSDSGAGVIGADAELRYRASATGTYIIGIFDETQFGPGSYALRIEER